MPNPIEVEREFQRTLSEIGTAPSTRVVYHLFWDFTEKLVGRYKKYDSYLLQLVDELPLFSHPLTWSGITPKVLERYIERLETIQNHLQSDSVSEAIRRLYEAALFQFICLNDAEGAGRVYKTLFGNDFPLQLGRISSKSEHEKFHLMVTNLEAAREQFHSLQTEKSADSLLRDFRFVLQQEQQSTFVPVVESYGTNDHYFYKSGRLRRLSVSVNQPATEGDRLVRRFNIYGAESAVYIESESVVAAARKLLQNTGNDQAGDYYKGSVEYTVNGLYHDGNSANAAISILWFMALFAKKRGRLRYSLKPGITITGDINSDGSILPIDKESIEKKAKAAFFSWATVLIVPAVQRKYFEKVIGQLKQDYPYRQLDLIGIGRIEEMLYDRRISNHKVISKTRYYARKLKEEKFKTVGIPTIVVLLLIIARLVYGPVDRNVVEIEFDTISINLNNISGYVVKRLETNQRTVQRHSQASPMGVLYDITMDGVNEFFYLQVGTTDNPPVVKAWSVSGDTLIWESQLSLNYEFPRQNSIYFSELNPNEIGLAQTGDEVKLIVQAGSVQYFQGLVFSFDPNTGELLSEYVHTGQIRDMVIINNDNDQNDKIVIAGVNNAFWEAFFAVLDADDLSGHSPTTIDYKPAGMEKASELIYARLPKTILGNYLIPLDKYNDTRMVRYDVTNKSLAVFVVEGRRYFARESHPADVLFHFNEQFRPAGIGSSDIYDVYVRDLYQQGEIPFEPGYDYFEALQDSILYWDGEEFVYTQEFFSDEP